jgi:alternate signal-mediated exported protein
MKKSTRGALAAAAAALLLFGGMGTRATWSDDDTIDGTDIGAGHLKLINPDCDGWLIGGNAFDPASVKIVPGSELTQVCTFEVDALGANLKATFSVTAPGFSATNGLTGVLQTSATYEDNATGDPVDATTVLEDGDVIKATLTVTLPSSADNTIQDLSATLNDVTVTASQA